MQPAKPFLIFVIILLLPLTAVAHKPYMTGSSDITIVSDMEISKAFYGELEGEPHAYIVKSSCEETLYVNILIPATEDSPNISDSDFSFTIIGSGLDESIEIKGSDYDWTLYHEEYGNDYYYMGPEFRQNVTGGTYTITVSNDDNSGKYALAIGEKEDFSWYDYPIAFIKAWWLDIWFFD